MQGSIAVRAWVNKKVKIAGIARTKARARASAHVTQSFPRIDDTSSSGADTTITAAAKHKSRLLLQEQDFAHLAVSIEWLELPGLSTSPAATAAASCTNRRSEF